MLLFSFSFEFQTSDKQVVNVACLLKDLFVCLLEFTLLLRVFNEGWHVAIADEVVHLGSGEPLLLEVKDVEPRESKGEGVVVSVPDGVRQRFVFVTRVDIDFAHLFSLLVENEGVSHWIVVTCKEEDLPTLERDQAEAAVDLGSSVEAQVDQLVSRVASVGDPLEVQSVNLAILNIDSHGRVFLVDEFPFVVDFGSP